MVYQTLFYQTTSKTECSFIYKAKGTELHTENRFAPENTFLNNDRIIESVSLSVFFCFFFILGVNTFLYDSACETQRY